MELHVELQIELHMERRRLDRFQNRCLREIWGIKPAFLSRVTNKNVLETTGESSLSTRLLQQQLLLFGKVFRLGDASVMRLATFRPGSLRLATDQFVRTTGRPRLEWASELYKKATRMTRNVDQLMELLSSPFAWKQAVLRCCT